MMSALWKFLAHASGRAGIELALPEGTDRFAGTAAAALDASARITVPSDTLLLIVTAELPDPELRTPADFIREIRERTDGRGWNLLEHPRDHGAWHTSAFNAACYALQRAHAGHLLELRVLNLRGNLLQIILHDARREDVALYR
jgi:hypothetical protein